MPRVGEARFDLAELGNLWEVPGDSRLLDSVRQTIQVDNQLKISFPEALMTFEIGFLGCGNES